ncbi:MAG: hypothetical protein AAF399_16320 [Bacteroidota bacterium]
MKSFIKLSTVAFAIFLFAGVSSLQAQRFSAMANFSSFDVDRTNAGGTQIDYQGSTSISANLRFYTDKKWAIRLGAGVDNLNYTVGDGINTNYSARRQDTKGILGLEKHFMIADFVDVYPGVYVPIIVVGDDIVSNNYQNISNGNIRSGLGVVLGANIKLLKILRVGVEFDASYDNFKEGFWESVDAKSFAPVRGINHTTNFVIGVAF